MEHHRLGLHNDAVTGPGGTPTEVDVVAEHRQAGIEADMLQHRTPHQHSRGVDREDITFAIVLALVVLATLQTRLAATGATDCDAQFE